MAYVITRLCETAWTALAWTPARSTAFSSTGHRTAPPRSRDSSSSTLTRVSAAGSASQSAPGKPSTKKETSPPPSPKTSNSTREPRSTRRTTTCPPNAWSGDPAPREVRQNSPGGAYRADGPAHPHRVSRAGARSLVAARATVAVEHLLAQAHRGRRDLDELVAVDALERGVDA